MTIWLLQIDITYDEAINDDYKYTAAAFNDDQDQTRWFYFKSNGKMIKFKYEEHQERLSTVRSMHLTSTVQW